jgi:hypothetical protein
MNKNAIKRQQRRNLKQADHHALAPAKRNESVKTPAINKKAAVRYQSDAEYPFIEYANRLPIPKVEVTLIDATNFKLTVLPSQF